MLVRDVMTNEPVACDPHMTADRAVKLMQDYDIGFLPVLKTAHGYTRVAGVVTDRDLCLRVLSTDVQPHRADIEHCMTPDAVTCLPTDTLQTAMSLMQEHRVRRLAVVDNSDRLLGVVTLSDIVRSRLVPPEDIIRTMRRVNRKKPNKVLAFAHN